MSLQSVLLTGATGNVGAILLEQLLEAGIKVNAVLRSFEKSKGFLEQKYSAEVAIGKLRFTEILDMSVAGVFDAPAKDVSAIIHVATPLADSDFKTTMIEPAWRINENILDAASKSSMVKRVIITGSIVAVMRLPDDLSKDATFNEKDFNNLTINEAVTNLPNAYSYSKVWPEQKAWEYIEEKSLSFDLVYLLAPLITGRSIQQGFKPTREGLGGMSAIYRELFDRDAVGSIFPFIMDVDDVARTHVQSLEMAAVPGNRRYLLVGGEMSATQLANKLRANYPNLHSRVPAAENEEPWPNSMAKYDTSRSDAVFGTNWIGWWESAMATVDDILKYEAANPAIS